MGKGGGEQGGRGRMRKRGREQGREAFACEEGGEPRSGHMRRGVVNRAAKRLHAKKRCEQGREAGACEKGGVNRAAKREYAIKGV